MRTTLRVIVGGLLAALLCWTPLLAAEESDIQIFGVGPDLVGAALGGMEGEWEGVGESSMGPFYAYWEAERVGNWIYSTTEIYTEADDMLVESMVQVFGVESDGTVVCHCFDSFGYALFTGAADANGGQLRWQAGEAWRELNWTMTDPDTMESSYQAHLPHLPPPMNDFWANETDVRASYGDEDWEETEGMEEMEYEDDDYEEDDSGMHQEGVMRPQ